jgi:hypothetical protein
MICPIKLANGVSDLSGKGQTAGMKPMTPAAVERARNTYIFSTDAQGRVQFAIEDQDGKVGQPTPVANFIAGD